MTNEAVKIAALASDVQSQISEAAACLANRDPGPWNAYGVTRVEASVRACNAINSELASLTASHHEQWNGIIDLKMMQGQNDPAALWAMYQQLVKADTRIAFDKGMNDPLTPFTPVCALSKGGAQIT